MSEFSPTYNIIFFLPPRHQREIVRLVLGIPLGYKIFEPKRRILSLGLSRNGVKSIRARIFIFYILVCICFSKGIECVIGGCRIAYLLACQFLVLVDANTFLVMAYGLGRQ